MNEYTTSSSSSTQQQPIQKKKTIRLVVMGGGYDTRSIKLLEQSLLMHGDNATTTSTQYNLLQRKHGQSQRKRRRRWYHRLLKRNNNSNNNDDDSTTTTIRTGNAFINITNTNYNLQAYELDLPEVVTAKRKLLLQRLFRRRPWLQSTTKTAEGVKRNENDDQEEEEEEEEFPILREANFNDLNATRKILEGILLNDDAASGDEDVTNIILFEGVMIYLDEGRPHALLELCSDVLRKCSSNNNSGSGNSSSSATTTTRALGYLCFSDRLENIPGGDEEAAQLEMECTGWELVDFLSKPGLARHMGVARVVV